MLRRAVGSALLRQQGAQLVESVAAAISQTQG